METNLWFTLLGENMSAWKRKGDGGGKKEDREGLRATILMTQLIRSLEQVRWLLKINAKLSKMATKRANGVI